LLREGLGGDGGAQEGLEAAGPIGDGLDTRARTGRRQRQAHAPGRDAALASTTRHVCAPGMQQRFGTHPWERLSDQAQWAVIHRELLALSHNNTHKRRVGWIAIKIHNEIKRLKVPTYVGDHHMNFQTIKVALLACFIASKLFISVYFGSSNPHSVTDGKREALNHIDRIFMKYFPCLRSKIA